MPITESVTALARAETAPRMKPLLIGVAGQLEQGRPIAEALAGLQLHLPLGPVREDSEPSGKADGDRLAAALDLLAGYCRTRGRIFAAARAAMSYPAVLVVGITALWLAYHALFLPLLEDYFRELGVGALPGGLQRALSISHFGPALIVFTVVVVLMLVRWYIPRLVSRLWLLVPLLGGLLRRLALSEFFAALALHWRRGTAPQQAFSAAADAVRDPWIRVRLQRTSVAQGQVVQVGPRLREAGLLRGCEGITLVAAEERGDGAVALARTAEAVQEDLLLRARRSIRVLPTVMVVIVGLWLLLTLSEVGSVIFETAGTLGPNGI
jgi:type II secretory pathway component PulF